MVSTWMGDHSSVEVDAVVKSKVKHQEWRIGASSKIFLGQKDIKNYVKDNITADLVLGDTNGPLRYEVSA